MKVLQLFNYPAFLSLWMLPVLWACNSTTTMCPAQFKTAQIGSTYLCVAESKFLATLYEARQICRGLNSDLLYIHSAAESEAIYSKLDFYNSMNWLDVKVDSGRLVWRKNKQELKDFHRFYPYPSVSKIVKGKCAVMVPLWELVDCNETMAGVVCRSPARWTPVKPIYYPISTNPNEVTFREGEQLEIWCKGVVASGRQLAFVLYSTDRETSNILKKGDDNIDSETTNISYGRFCVNLLKITLNMTLAYNYNGFELRCSPSHNPGYPDETCSSRDSLCLYIATLNVLNPSPPVSSQRKTQPISLLSGLGYAVFFGALVVVLLVLSAIIRRWRAKRRRSELIMEGAVQKSLQH